MHLQPVYREGTDPRYPDTKGAYPVSEELWERGLYLPSGFTLDEPAIDRVVEALRRVLGR